MTAFYNEIRNFETGYQVCQSYGFLECDAM